MREPAVRRARPDDVAALAALLDRWGGDDDPDEKVVRYRERLATTIEQGAHHVVVAELDGEVVGYAAAQDYGPALRRDWSIARMHDLWVAPPARGAGAGTALFDATREWASRETRIRFLQWQSSAVAVDFYGRLGLTSRDDASEPIGAGPEYELEFHLPGREA